MEDLYQKPLKGGFTRLCGGNQQEEDNESCVESAPIDGGGIALRDSKPGGHGRELRFTHAEVAAFVQGYASEHGLSL